MVSKYHRLFAYHMIIYMRDVDFYELENNEIYIYYFHYYFDDGGDWVYGGRV